MAGRHRAEFRLMNVLPMSLRRQRLVQPGFDTRSAHDEIVATRATLAWPEAESYGPRISAPFCTVSSTSKWDGCISPASAASTGGGSIHTRTCGLTIKSAAS